MQVFTQISALFILMGAGFAFGRMKIIEGPAVRTLSTLIIKATLPALIVVSLQKPFSRELLKDSAMTLAVATGFYLFIIALSLLAVRLLGTPKRQAGPFVFALSFSNAAFIGFPVVSSILGPSALFLTSIHNILFNVLAFSAGIVIMSRSAEGAHRPLPLSRILNANVIASFAGFTLFLLSVRLPQALFVPLEMLGSLTTPLAMITTGAMLARTPMRSVVGDWRVYAVTALRLAAWPALVALVVRFLPVSRELALITVIIAAMPAASNTSLIAEVYGGDTDTASATVFLTTLLSVASIPVLALFIG